MQINFNNEDNDSLIIAMEVGYQAISDLVSLYKKINNEVLKQLAIFEGKSIKEIKKEINNSLLIEDKEKELLSKIKASQEMILRFNESLKRGDDKEGGQ